MRKVLLVIGMGADMPVERSERFMDKLMNTDFRPTTVSTPRYQTTAGLGRLSSRLVKTSGRSGPPAAGRPIMVATLFVVPKSSPKIEDIEFPSVFRSTRIAAALGLPAREAGQY